jgi:hypothetical protein
MHAWLAVPELTPELATLRDQTVSDISASMRCSVDR